MKHLHCAKSNNGNCKCYDAGINAGLGKREFSESAIEDHLRQHSKNIFYEYGKKAGKRELAEELLKEDAGCEEIGQNEKTRYLWLMAQLEEEAGLNTTNEKETTGKNTQFDTNDTRHESKRRFVEASRTAPATGVGAATARSKKGF
jgi:hypothetical protein